MLNVQVVRAVCAGCALSAASLAATSVVIAQDAHAHHAAHAHGAAAITDKARAQIDSARAAFGVYNTPAKAIAAGFIPVLGDIPLQGVHYVNREVVEAARFDLNKPSMLLFSPLGDSIALVGAAYGYRVPESDPDPEGFDGDADAWHEHPILARGGQRVTMVHLWLNDPPDGPFAHDNATLPFAARSMSTPDASWMAGSALRDLALALSLADATGDRLVRMSRAGGETLRVSLKVDRDGINAIAAQLSDAQKAGDRTQYLSLAGKAVAHSNNLIATLKNSAPNPVMREAVGRLIDEFIGNHSSPMTSTP